MRNIQKEGSRKGAKIAKEAERNKGLCYREGGVLKSLCLAAFLGIFAGCTPNMQRTPNRWVTVIDADSGKPVTDLPLVYTGMTGLVFGGIEFSRDYVTGSDGRAFVPLGKFMVPGLIHSKDVGYVYANDHDSGKTHRELLHRDVIYVRTFKSHMKRLREMDDYLSP